MESPSDSADPLEQDRPDFQAPSTSDTIQDGDLMDLLETSEDEVEELPPEGPDSSSPPQDTMARKDTAPFYSGVFRRFARLRGGPSQAVGAERHIETRRKLEHDMARLRQAHQNLETEHRGIVMDNKQLASEKKTISEKYEANKRDNRKVVKVLADKLKSANTANEDLRRDYMAAQRQIRSLTNEVNTAKENLETSEQLAQDEIARLSSVADSVNLDLQAEREKYRTETAHLHAQINTISEMNDRFRQMLIPVPENQISDCDVAHKFTTLRSSILAFVRRIWTLKMRAEIDVQSLPRGHREFFQSSIPRSYDRLRYVVSAFLYHGIFEAPNYFLGDEHKKFDDQLREVERHLFKISPRENLKLAMDWRIASLKATEIFRDDGHRLSLTLQEQIWKLFSALELMDATAEEAGKKKLEAVCDSAVELHLMLRRLKDSFWVDALQRAVDQPISEWGELAEQMAQVQAIDGKQPGTIAYVIAGALVKSPKENLGKSLVLEKAEVAVYC